MYHPTIYSSIETLSNNEGNAMYYLQKLSNSEGNTERTMYYIIRIIPQYKNYQTAKVDSRIIIRYFNHDNVDTIYPQNKNCQIMKAALGSRFWLYHSITVNDLFDHDINHSLKHQTINYLYSTKKMKQI